MASTYHADDECISWTKTLACYVSYYSLDGSDFRNINIATYDNFVYLVYFCCLNISTWIAYSENHKQW